jgi:hypothetical protein
MAIRMLHAPPGERGLNNGIISESKSISVRDYVIYGEIYNELLEKAYKYVFILYKQLCGRGAFFSFFIDLFST